MCVSVPFLGAVHTVLGQNTPSYSMEIQSMRREQVCLVVRGADLVRSALSSFGAAALNVWWSDLATHMRVHTYTAVVRNECPCARVVAWPSHSQRPAFGRYVFWLLIRFPHTCVCTHCAGVKRDTFAPMRKHSPWAQFELV